MSYIQVEDTPNPLAMKFLVEEELLPLGKTFNASSTLQASVSPLASELFQMETVSNVFIGSTFVTITKEPFANWDDLKLEVIEKITYFLRSGLPILNQNSPAKKEFNSSDPIFAQIEAILEEKIRPSIAQDGGDVIFQGFEDGIVYLELQGSCSGCPSSAITLKNGIENLLKYYIPEILMVQQI